MLRLTRVAHCVQIKNLMTWGGDIWAPDTPNGRASLERLAEIWNHRCGPATHVVLKNPLLGEDLGYLGSSGPTPTTDYLEG